MQLTPTPSDAQVLLSTCWRPAAFRCSLAPRVLWLRLSSFQSLSGPRRPEAVVYGGQRGIRLRKLTSSLGILLQGALDHSKPLPMHIDSVCGVSSSSPPASRPLPNVCMYLMNSGYLSREMRPLPPSTHYPPPRLYTCCWWGSIPECVVPFSRPRGSARCNLAPQCPSWWR